MIAQPYPGLRPFNRDEDEIFFGRETHVNQLLDKLTDAHFIAVLGTSGSGKSSLVRAGLLPALDGGFMAGGGAQWAVAELRPGDKPFHRLAAALVQDTEWGQTFAASEHCEPGVPCEQNTTAEPDNDNPPPSGPDSAISILEKDLRRGSLALNWRLGVQALPEDTRLLILVDQFEELFRYHKTAGLEASAFVALLLAAATHSSVYVVITMRSEFLGDCARYPELPEAINAGLFLTPRLSPEQMADAIQLPAKLYGCEVTTKLANRLLKDARGEMDQLPLLQHALMRLWHRKTREGKLTLTELDELGGLRKALNDHAEEAFNELDNEQKRIAEIMFRALTERGPAERDTRRPVPLKEIQELAEVSLEEVEQVVDVFRRGDRSFLNTAADTLDISHEALIRQWERLHDWTADEYEQAELYQRLEASARRQEEGKGALWIDPDLQYALEWREEHDPNPRWAKRYGGDFELAMQFLDASLEERKKQQQRIELGRLKELQRSNRIALASMVALIITMALAGWALFERGHAKQSEAEAKRHAAIAEQRQIHAKAIEQNRTESLFDSSVTHASLLAQVDNPAEARAVLRETAQLDQSIPESRRHARNLLAGYVDILGGRSEKTYEGAGAALLDVAISPDGRLLVAGGERGTLVVFDAETGELRKRLIGHDVAAENFGAVRAVVFTQQGDALYSAGHDGRIIRWSMPGGERQNDWETPNQVWSLALSPDGKILASRGQGDDITLWDTNTGKPRPLKGNTSLKSGGNTLAFSPNGEWLIGGGNQGDVGIWEVNSGQERMLPRRHTAQVTAVAVSPDGKWIATGSGDKGIVIWNAKNFRPLKILQGHENIIMGLTFDDDSQRLLSSSRDKTLRLWDVTSGVPLKIYQGHTTGLWTVASHGTNLYTSSDDGTVRRWSEINSELCLWEIPDGSPESTAISPDGKIVAVGHDNGTLQVFKLPNGELTYEKLEAHDGNINRIAFSSEGHILATASHDSMAKLWRIEQNVVGPRFTLLHTLEGHSGPIHTIAFSPDNLTLATAGYDGKVGVFDVESGNGKLFEAHDQCRSNGCVGAVEFSKDGRQLMSVGYADKKIRIWDITEKTPEHRDVGQAQGFLLWAALRPDGRQIAAVGRDLITLYDLSEDAGPPHRLVGHEQTVYRAIYSPDGTQLATVSWDMTVRIWDLSTGKALFTLRLPAEFGTPGPLWDFDFRCTPDGNCWIAVPLTMGRLALYRLPYENPPKSITDPTTKDQ